MKVRLNTDFLAPDGNLYREGVHEVPENWTLPTNSEQVADDTPVSSFSPTAPKEIALSSLAPLTFDQKEALLKENKDLGERIKVLEELVAKPKK